MSETTGTGSRGRGDQLVEWFIMLGVAFIAVLGFVTSFDAVTKRMHQAFGHFDWCVPTAFDAGIFFFSAAHIYLTRRKESHWLLRAVPLVLTGVTVYMNVSSVKHDAAGSVAHGGMVSLWAVAVVVAEHVAKKRLKLARGEEVDSIPLARYLWDPFRTIVLRRRMILTAETSYRRAVELEKARLYAKGLVSTRAKGVRVPPLLRREIAAGDLPDEVVAAVDQVLASGAGAGWKAYVFAWVARDLAAQNPLPEGVAAGSQNPLPVGVPEGVTAGSQEGVTDGSRRGSQEGVTSGSKTPSQEGVTNRSKRGSQKGVTDRSKTPRPRTAQRAIEAPWDEAAFVKETADRYEEENDGDRLTINTLMRELKEAGHGRGRDTVKDLIARHYGAQESSLPREPSLRVMPGGK